MTFSGRVSRHMDIVFIFTPTGEGHSMIRACSAITEPASLPKLNE